jgi:outer membrane lipoprotein SlyB
MKRTFAAATLLAFASIAPVQDAAAQNEPLIGGILGGAFGAGVGAAIGGSAGAAIAGGIIGGATGAMIGAAAQPRPRGYWYYENACYVRVSRNRYRPVDPRYCY